MTNQWTEQIEKLQQENNKMKKALEFIATFSAGWDKDGCVGPKEPFSWETVGRISLDIARSTLIKIEAN